MNAQQGLTTPVRKRSNKRIARRQSSKHYLEESVEQQQSEPTLIFEQCTTPPKTPTTTTTDETNTSFSSPGSISLSALKITTPSSQNNSFPFNDGCKIKDDEISQLQTMSDHSFLTQSFPSFNMPLIMMEDDSEDETIIPSQHTSLTQEFGNVQLLTHNNDTSQCHNKLFPFDIIGSTTSNNTSDNVVLSVDGISPIISLGNQDIFEDYFQNLNEIESRSRSNSYSNKPFKKRKTYTLSRLKGLPVVIKHVILSFLPYVPLKFNLRLAFQSPHNQYLFETSLIKNSFGRYNAFRSHIFMPFLNVELVLTKEEVGDSDQENLAISPSTATSSSLSSGGSISSRNDFEIVCLLYAPIFNHVRNLKISTLPCNTVDQQSPITANEIQTLMKFLSDCKSRYSLKRSFSSSPFVNKYLGDVIDSVLPERKLFSRLETIYFNIEAPDSLSIESDSQTTTTEPFIFSPIPYFDNITTHINLNKNFVPVTNIIPHLNRYPKLNSIHTCLYFPDGLQNNNLNLLQSIQSLKICNISPNLLEILLSSKNQIRNLDLRGLNYSPLNIFMKIKNTLLLQHLSIQFSENDIVTDIEFTNFLKSNCIPSLRCLEIFEPETRSRARQECTLDGICHNISITKLSLVFFLHLGALAAENLSKSNVTSLTIANSFRNATHFSAFMEGLSHNSIIKRLHISTFFSSRLAFESFLKSNKVCEKFIGEFDDKTKLLVLDINCLGELKLNMRLKVLKLLNFTFDTTDDEIERVLNGEIPQIDVTICRKTYISSFSE